MKRLLRRLRKLRRCPRCGEWTRALTAHMERHDEPIVRLGQGSYERRIYK